MSLANPGLAIPLVLSILSASQAEELGRNQWIKLEKAGITGQRTDVPVAFVPALGRFMVLGGRTHFREHREEERPYDQLAFDLQQDRWENWFPVGKESWGPKLGATFP